MPKGLQCILIVEPDVYYRELLLTALQGWFPQASICMETESDRVLQIARDRLPELVFVAGKVEGLPSSGASLVRILRQQGCRATIVMVVSDSSVIRDALREGANKGLVKVSPAQDRQALAEELTNLGLIINRKQPTGSAENRRML